MIGIGGSVCWYMGLVEEGSGCSYLDFSGLEVLVQGIMPVDWLL